MTTTPADAHVILAAYDLSVSPSSFDVLSFLVEAEKYREEKGLDALHVVVIPGVRNFDVNNDDQEKWRLSNIVVPACGLLSSVRAITIADSRDQASNILARHSGTIFPTGYSIEQPVAHHHTAWPIISSHLGVNLQSLHASPQAKRYARQWIDARSGGRKAVALTLREAEFTSLRNSDIAQWTRFARLLETAGYFPIVVRDTDRALDMPGPAFDGITMFPEAAFNLDLRIAFYEECHIAAFVSNGPSHACYFDRDVRYLYFVTGEWRMGNPPAFYRVGVGENTSPPFCNAYQRWLWCEQDADLFMMELQDLDQTIESRRSDGTYDQSLMPIESHREPLAMIAHRMRTYSDRHGSPADWQIIAAVMDMTPERLFADLDYTFQLARASFRSHDFDRAADLYRYLLSKAPSEGVCLEAGMTFEALEHMEEARAVYRDAVSALPDSILLKLRLNVTEAELGNVAVAATFFRDLIARGVTAPQIFLELGKIYERKEDWIGALAVYDEAIAKGGLDQQVLARKLDVARKISAG